MSESRWSPNLDSIVIEDKEGNIKFDGSKYIESDKEESNDGPKSKDKDKDKDK